MGKLNYAILGFIVLLYGVPLLVSGYWERVLASLFMMTALTYAQNVLLGYTGYPAFGAIAFFGIGGYTTALLMTKFGIPFLLSLLFGGIVASVVALAIAPVLMRLKSHYFAITTLALQIALAELFANLDVTGGAYGINLPIYRGFLGTSMFYYLFLSILLMSFLINIFLEYSRFGYAFKAIREDETAAESSGVNTVLFKSISFGIMAFITGLVGGTYAYWITYIDPESMFDLLLSVKMFVALLFGGVGTVAGPFIGAFSLELVSELVWSKFIEFHGVVLGAIIVLVILMLPGGILRSRS
jgi:branched-chain amino acid transport system permease protein